MKGYPQPELHFDESELKTDLGEGNIIFVGSSCDMWAAAIPAHYIRKTLALCCLFPNNRYLFQSKNPKGFGGWQFPPLTILGITLESNRCSNVSKAPCPQFRYTPLATMNYPRMVSIEPIMDFDLEEMVDWIKQIRPEFVSIGADSKGHNLPEPPADKVRALIKSLKEITEVKVKDNLNRLLGQHSRE